jgi:hypothetical protein
LIRSRQIGDRGVINHAFGNVASSPLQYEKGPMSVRGQKATSRPYNPTSAIASGADIVRNGSEEADTAIVHRTTVLTDMMILRVISIDLVGRYSHTKILGNQRIFSEQFRDFS